MTDNDNAKIEDIEDDEPEAQPDTAAVGATPNATMETPLDAPVDDPVPVAVEAPVDDRHLRMVEALLFAAEEPLNNASIAKRLPDDADLPTLLAALQARYEDRGVNLIRIAGKWALRTAPDLHFLLQEHRQETRKLSRAAQETLAIIAYHQPVTRAEVEEVRGVGLSKGTLDLLMEIGWVKPRGRRRTLGRPLTYGVTDGFLDHFGLETIKDLPGIQELKAAGLLEGEVSLPLVLRKAAEDGEDPLDDEDTQTEMAHLSPALPDDAADNNDDPEDEHPSAA